MKLLITRPEESSQKLARRLGSMGHEIILSPLQTIKFRPAGELNLEDVQGFVVTSANGVEGLIKGSENRDLPLYAVGNKTAEAAKNSGFKTVFSADGDVDTLAALIIRKASKSGGVLLHAGGARLAGDLKERLEKAGFRYRREILYDAVDATNFHPSAITALEDETLDGVVLFSPYTAKIFTNIIEQEGLSPHLKGVTAWCLSNNVALEIASLPFWETIIAPSPTEASLLGQLTVKSAKGEAGIKMDTDRTRGQIVSKTPKQDKEAPPEKPWAGEAKKPEETVFATPATDAQKPLPDALTGKGGAAPKAPFGKSAKPAKSSAGRIALALFVFFCLGLAAWPLIFPKVSPYLPAETRQIIQGYLGNPAGDKKLEDRLAALEKSVSSQNSSAASPDLGPIKTSLKENMDLVTTVNGQITDLAEKVDLQQTRLSDRLQAEEAQSQNLGASIVALKEHILKIQGAAPVRATSATVPVITEPTPEILASLNGLETALDQLKSDLASVRQGLSNTATDTAAQKDQLRALSVALQSRIAEEVEKTTNGNDALVLLALGQLHRESRTKQPFEGALRQTLAAAPEAFQPDLVALSTVAKSGAKARRDLIVDFSAIANDITQASRLPTSETWYGKTLHNIASLVKFRRVDDVTGESVDAVVARAEEKLQGNDLAGATEILKSLTGDPADVAAGWIVDAEKRVLVDRSLADLLNKATAIAVQSNETVK